MSFNVDEVVVELEIVKYNGVWYRRGLNMYGKECWEEMRDEEAAYADNWLETILQEVEKGGAEWV